MSDDVVGLDPDWIKANVVVDSATPAAVEFGGFIGTGQMSRNARWHLDWGDGDGPTSVVVKIPSADEMVRGVSFEHGIYQKECDFYLSVRALTDVAAPALVASYVADDDFCLVLEDLSGSEQGDQFTEPTDDQLILAIEQAAALQAPVWGKLDQPAFDSYRVDIEERAAGYAAQMEFFYAVVKDRLGPGIDGEVTAMLDEFVPICGAYIGKTEPVTLVHGDFRPDNFLFAVEADAPPIMVVDWQTLALGVGTTDVAYLLGAAISAERRREVEHDMIDRYLAKLAARGVDHPREQCLQEYAIGSLHGIFVAMAATTMAEQTERGDALFTLMLNRHGRHALDMGAVDLLR